MAHLQKPKGFRSAAEALVHGRMHRLLGLRRGDINQARLGADLIKQVKGLSNNSNPSSSSPPPESKP